MLQDTIAGLITNHSASHPLYVRNLLKEELQNYILNCIYTTSEYRHLLFTGGTCLRKVYGLNRLSEDLDFDYLEQIEIEDFAQLVTSYFTSVVQYSACSYSISKNQRTVYLKFPILKELNLKTDGTPEALFIRCDFSPESTGGYETDQNMIAANQFQFFVTSYDLPTLFANKIVAFLERSIYKGKQQTTPFKGRDVYDLHWLLQLSAKSSFSLKVNTKRLKKLLGTEDLKSVVSQCLEKVAILDTSHLYDDIFPLFESQEVVKGFIESYQTYIPKYLGLVITDQEATA